MELANCESFVRSASAEFERFARSNGLQFTPLKHGFWIRDAYGRSLFQGNYTIKRLRPFMPYVQAAEQARLNHPVPYKNSKQGGYRFYVENPHDIEVAKSIILARLS